MNTDVSPFTDFLYARPSFLEGAARLVDLGGTLNTYNLSASPEEADLVALRADWMAVGADLGRAIEGYAEEHAGDLGDAPAR